MAVERKLAELHRTIDNRFWKLLTYVVLIVGFLWLTFPRAATMLYCAANGLGGPGRSRSRRT